MIDLSQFKDADITFFVKYAREYEELISPYYWNNKGSRWGYITNSPYNIEVLNYLKKFPTDIIIVSPTYEHIGELMEYFKDFIEVA